jgi:hypothetical protein
MAFRKAAGGRAQPNAAVALRDVWQVTSGTRIRGTTFDQRAAASAFFPPRETHPGKNRALQQQEMLD